MPPAPQLPAARQRLLAQARDLAARGRTGEAIDLFQLLAEAGDDGALWDELAHLHTAQRDYAAAVAAFDRALELGVARAEEAHVNRGLLLADYLRRTSRAEKDFRAALSLVPGYPPAMLALGMLQEQLHQPGRALATYDRLLAAPAAANAEDQPLRLKALARSAQLRPAASKDDPLLSRLQRAADDHPDKAIRASLLSTLGRNHELLGDYEAAFEHYTRANRWAARGAAARYDRARTEQVFQALIAATPTPAVVGPEAFAGSRAEPLFICGNFRSGCALLERALSAHPQVTAAGPITHLRHVTRELAPFPSSLANLPPERASALAQQYRSELAKLFPKGIRGGYIIDSRPDNFMLIGLAKLLFPGARIVHTVRNPMDNALAIFAHHLPLRVAEYSADLGDIGHYFGLYQRMMFHYKALYPESIIDFDYDAFVADPASRLAQLLGALDLPWDDRCLDFLQAPVATPRRRAGTAADAVHDRYSGRWRHFSHHLDPLRAELQAAGLPVKNPPAARPRAQFTGRAPA